MVVAGASAPPMAQAPVSGCGASGCATASLLAGVSSVKATSGVKTTSALRPRSGEPGESWVTMESEVAASAIWLVPLGTSLELASVLMALPPVPEQAVMNMRTMKILLLGMLPSLHSLSPRRPRNFPWMVEQVEHFLLPLLGSEIAKGYSREPTCHRTDSE